MNSSGLNVGVCVANFPTGVGRTTLDDRFLLRRLSALSSFSGSSMRSYSSGVLVLRELLLDGLEMTLDGLEPDKGSLGELQRSLFGNAMMFRPFGH